MKLSELITKYRVKNGLSYREMGKKLGCSHNQVNLLEKGDLLPTEKSLRKIAEVLEMDLDKVRSSVWRKTGDEYLAYLTDGERKKRGIKD